MHHPVKKRAILIICNMLLLATMISIALIYSRTFTQQENAMKVEVFCNTVEAMKQVSENYLYTEKGYVDDWVAYIEDRQMTAEEALEYIRKTNTQEDRTANLINMDDFSARSTYIKNESEWVHCYEEMEKLGTADAKSFLEKMQRMFEADSEELLVLGKYREGMSQRTVISVGERVQIKEEDGTEHPYLLLRLIPADYFQKAWVFPTEYPDAEISLIAKDGGYVVQSNSLRSKNFLEFIRGYNFTDNYNEVDSLAERLATSDQGLLEYKDSKGQDCYFYYSSMSNDSNLDILGYVPVSKIKTDAIDWTIVVMICGTLLVMMILDGVYILSINRKLRKAIKMVEKANMAKTEFLSSMSHDIRTPMNAVIGMTEIAKRHLDDPAYVGECLDKVALSGNHLLTLVNDILDISKVESGKMTLNVEDFSLGNTVAQMEEIVSQLAQDKEIEFTTSIHDIQHDEIEGDALRLRQILLNILTNAVKYTEKGGHVFFEISQYPVETAGRIGLRFLVKDDGMGMSKEFQQTMYSNFSRETDSRINVIQGSGLGLSIVHKMVELMNGTIQCDSTLGKGTTFIVSLEFPVGEQPEISAKQADTEAESEKFTGMQVLVAEDNDLNWEIIHIMLEEYGVQSERAENGQRCLEMLKEKGAHYYNMIFMDVQMPVMDGKEATRRLRESEDKELRNIPIIAMTADAFAEDIHACLEAGMDDHISKPVEMKRVLEVMRKVKKGTICKERRK